MILAILLLIAACKPVDPVLPLTNEEYRRGTLGLEMRFLPNAPPAKMFEESEFEVETELWNRGAYTITEGYITAILENAYMCVLDGEDCVSQKITDADQATLSKLRVELESLRTDREKNAQSRSGPLDGQVLTDEIAQIDRQIAEKQKQISDLEKKVQTVNPKLTLDFKDLAIEEFKGRSVSTPDGTRIFAKWPASAKKLDLLAEQHTSPVTVTACYRYSAELAREICIDPNPSATGAKACVASDYDLESQGAPVAFSRIETRIVPRGEYVEPQFVLYVTNAGTGEVVNSSALRQVCSSSGLGYKDWNHVVLREFAFANQEYRYEHGKEGNIECRPAALRLSDSGYFRCVVKDSQIRKGSAAFTTQAYAVLDYGYTDSITTQVVVEDTQ